MNELDTMEALFAEWQQQKRQRILDAMPYDWATLGQLPLPKLEGTYDKLVAMGKDGLIEMRRVPDGEDYRLEFRRSQRAEQ